MQQQIDLIDEHYPSDLVERHVIPRGRLDLEEEIADPADKGTVAVGERGARDLLSAAFEDVVGPPTLGEARLLGQELVQEPLDLGAPRRRPKVGNQEPSGTRTALSSKRPATRW